MAAFAGGSGRWRLRRVLIVSRLIIFFVSGGYAFVQALFDCLARQEPREPPDLPLREGRQLGEAVDRLSGLQGEGVTQPGGEGYGGGPGGLGVGAAAPS